MLKIIALKVRQSLGLLIAEPSMDQKTAGPLYLSQHKVLGEVIFEKLQFREKKHLIFESFGDFLNLWGL